VKELDRRTFLGTLAVLGAGLWVAALLGGPGGAAAPVLRQDLPGGGDPDAPPRHRRARRPRLAPPARSIRRRL
jgi:hypothetical protein